MIQLYKPNKNNTGHAFSIKLVGDAFIATLLKQAQAGQEKKGAFSGNRKQVGKEINVKINATEACGMIDAMERNVNWNTLHDNQAKNKYVKIVFEPYVRLDNATKVEKQLGFSFQISENPKDNSQQKANYAIGFTFGESVLLKNALLVGVRTILLNEQRKQDQYREKGKNNTPAPAPLESPEPSDSAEPSQEPDFAAGEQPTSDDTVTF